MAARQGHRARAEGSSSAHLCRGKSLSLRSRGLILDLTAPVHPSHSIRLTRRILRTGTILAGSRLNSCGTASRSTPRSLTVRPLITLTDPTRRGIRLTCRCPSVLLQMVLPTRKATLSCCLRGDASARHLGPCASTNWACDEGSNRTSTGCHVNHLSRQRRCCSRKRNDNRRSPEACDPQAPPASDAGRTASNALAGS